MPDKVEPTSEDWSRILAQVGYNEPPQQDASEPESKWDDDLLPTDFVDEDQVGLDPKGVFVDDHINIVDAYARWCAKSEIKRHKGQTESIKVSCPNPAHPDKRPSAWLNTDKGRGGLYYCGGCGEGGDRMDIAAWYFDYPVPDYKYDREMYRALIAEMAYDFGYVDEHFVGHSDGFDDSSDDSADDSEGGSPDDDEDDKSEPVAESAKILTLPVTPIPEHVPPQTSEDDGEWLGFNEEFKWWDVYDPDGFRYSYMMETAIGRLIPHEFFAAGADTLLGLAANRHISLMTTVKVYPNLYVCLAGRTGAGKSISQAPIERLIDEVMPYRASTGHGVKLIPEAGSGEALIKMMQADGIDPETSQPVFMPVTGYTYYDELSDFVIKSSRRGSTLQPTVIQMYGAVDRDMSTFSLTGGSISCHRPFLSFMTGTQPRAMRELLNDHDLVGGFLNRFMFYVGKKPPMPAGYNPTRPNPFRLGDSKAKLEALVKWADGLKEHGLTWTEKAEAAYFSAFRSEGWGSDAGDDVPVLARTELMFLKFILLNCLDVQARAVKVGHVERAFEQLQYAKKSMLFAARSVESTLYDECMEKILRSVRNHDDGNGATAGQIRHDLRSSKYMDIFDRVLKHMCESGMLKMARIAPKSKKGGRPTYRYKIS